jgi:hypothetical protein
VAPMRAQAMKTQQTITTLPMSPHDDRRSRMLKYTITMSIRVVCVLLLFVVHGWWLLPVALGAVLLPYIAVVVANNVSGGTPNSVERPGGIVVVSRPVRPTVVEPRALDAGE